MDGQAGGLGVRADIDDVYASLDPSGQDALSGSGTTRRIRDTLELLPELLPDEVVIGLAVGMDRAPTGREQGRMGAGAALGAIAQTAKSSRLLVVTETNFWEVRAGGRFQRGRAEATCASLADIGDVRPISQRRLSRFGAKERLIGIDHLRGEWVGTQIIVVVGGDQTLEGFAKTLSLQVARCRERTAQG